VKNRLYVRNLSYAATTKGLRMCFNVVDVSEARIATEAILDGQRLHVRADGHGDE
jgi:hypothetical protein